MHFYVAATVRQISKGKPEQIEREVRRWCKDMLALKRVASSELPIGCCRCSC